MHCAHVHGCSIKYEHSHKIKYKNVRKGMYLAGADEGRVRLRSEASAGRAGQRKAGGAGVPGAVAGRAGRGAPVARVLCQTGAAATRRQQ